LIASDGEASDYLGYSVAVDSDTAVVGVYVDDDLGSEAGAAYVFVRDSSGVWRQQQKMTADDGEAGDYYAEADAVSLDTIVIGADGDDDVGSNTGAVYVYVRDSAGYWSLQQKLTASNGVDNDSFGNALDLDGDTAVIGTSGYYFDTDGTAVQSSSAYAFTRDGSDVWNEQELDPTVNVDTEWYGRSVSVSGDSIAVGAYGDSDVDVFAGAVYLFERDTAGLWNLQQKITAYQIRRTIQTQQFQASARPLSKRPTITSQRSATRIVNSKGTTPQLTACQPRRC